MGLAEIPDFMYVDPERPHLGGYLKGGDPGCYCPELWTWLIREQGVKTVVDVGCGDGHAVRFFRDLGCVVRGVDGIAQDDPDILEHDYSNGAYYVWPPKRTDSVDLCWSCEFVEHVEERYLKNFLATFSCASMVLMTHALPGQGGHHHVNCQDQDYWIGALAAVGLSYDEELTAKTRSLVSPCHYYARTGLAFR